MFHVKHKKIINISKILKPKSSKIKVTLDIYNKLNINKLSTHVSRETSHKITILYKKYLNNTIKYLFYKKKERF